MGKGQVTVHVKYARLCFQTQVLASQHTGGAAEVRSWPVTGPDSRGGSMPLCAQGQVFNPYSLASMPMVKSSWLYLDKLKVELKR